MARRHQTETVGYVPEVLWTMQSRQVCHSQDRTALSRGVRTCRRCDDVG